MATAKPGTSTEIEEIQRRMAQIRHDMHGEVLGAVKGVRSLTDWRSLTRNHPLATLGLAAAIGYLVVPRRRSEAPTIVAVNTTAPGVAGLAEPQKQSEKSGSITSSIIRTAFTLAAPIAVRAAQNYSMQYIEGLLARHAFPQEQAKRDGRRTGNGARPGAPRGPSERLRQPR